MRKSRTTNEKHSFSVQHQVELLKMLKSYVPETRRIFIMDAKKRIDELELGDEEKKKLFYEYCKDYKKYRQTFKEFYYGYRFPMLSEKRKSEFLTMRDTQFILRKYRIIYPEQWTITGRKEIFLKEYSDFIHRKWMLVDSSTPSEDIQQFINSFDVIAKPTDAESGKGVFKISQGKADARQILSGKLPILLEECVKNVDVLAAFHPSSLNTIRVVTISNGEEAKLFAATLRTGNNNSVYDNCDAGGYFAEVDTETGEILSNGVTEMGDEVEFHPISGKRFKGLICPNWSEVVKVCKKAALYNPKMVIVAWDIAITPLGIEIIEANSIPSVEIHQVPLHTGVRKKFYGMLEDLDLPYKDVMFWAKVISKLTEHERVNKWIGRIVKKKNKARVSLRSEWPLDKRIKGAMDLYEKAHGYRFDINNPVLFTEKVVWYKLFYERPDFTRIVDKYFFKDYILEKLGDGYTIPLIGVWDNIESLERDWENLPEEFCLKSTLQSDGYSIKIIHNRSTIDFSDIKNELNRWLKPENTLINSYCKAYYKATPRIIAEVYKAEVGNQLYDYKIFCFNGNPKYAYVATEHFSDKTYPISFYNLDWKKLNVYYGNHRECEVEKPKDFEEMISISRVLSKDFPFVRVDFFETDEQLYVAEMTLYPGGGQTPIFPVSFNLEMGNQFVLPT